MRCVQPLPQECRAHPPGWEVLMVTARRPTWPLSRRDRSRPAPPELQIGCMERTEVALLLGKGLGKGLAA